AEDGIRDFHVTGVQTCALPILEETRRAAAAELAEARRLREESQRLREELVAARAELEARRQAVLEKAREEARRLLHAARREAERAEERRVGKECRAGRPPQHDG